MIETPNTTEVWEQLDEPIVIFLKINQNEEKESIFSLKHEHRDFNEMHAKDQHDSLKRKNEALLKSTIRNCSNSGL